MSDDSAYKDLIARYAKGRTICNCGKAYLTNCGMAVVDGVKVNDYPTCADGCSSAQIDARNDVAKRAMKELYFYEGRDYE